MGFEQNLQNSIFQSSPEKTFVDKVLARKDVDALRDLMRKEELSRGDLLEILHLVSGIEQKLLNYGEWDRYIILKFFVWIREFVKIAEILYDYNDKLVTKERDKKQILSGRAKELLHNNRRLMEHNIKFLVDLYFNIGRTSLSVGATGLLELLKNKYELVYPNQGGLSTGQEVGKS